MLCFVIALLATIGASAQSVEFVTDDIDSLKASVLLHQDPFSIVADASIIAELYCRQRNYDSSAVYRDLAFENLYQISDTDQKEEGYLRIIDAIIINMNLDSFVQEAFSVVKAPARLADIYLTLDEYYYAVRDDYQTDACLEVLDSVKYFLDRIEGPHEFEIEYLTKRANCYLHEFKLFEALGILLEAKSKVKPEDNRSAEVYSQIARIYNDIHAHDKAIESATQAKMFALQNKDYFHSFNAISELNRAFLAQGKYADLKLQCAEALKIEAAFPGNDKATIYTTLGTIALKEAKLDSAKYFFEKVVTGPGAATSLTYSDAHEGLSLVAFAKGDLTEAKRQVALAEEVYPWVYPDILDRSEKTARIHLAEKDYEAASEYLLAELELMKLRDSLNNPYEVISTLLNDNFEQDKAALNREITLQKRIGRQKLMLGLGLAVLGFMALFYWYDRKQKNKITGQLKQMVSDQTKEIRQQRDKLAKLDQFKSRFYTNITHEFRTPLTVILGTADHLKTANETQQKNRHYFLDLIERNGKNLLNLINQILDLSKIQDDNLAVQFVQSDIIKYTHYLANSFYTYANDRNIMIRVRSKEAELLMDFDIEKYRQIFTNLVSNAIKYSSSGDQITISLEKVVAESKDPLFVLGVEDTGMGIAAEQIAHIFDRFYQSDDEVAKAGGTGIGLALTKELVNLLNGSIEVESEVGKGSIFSISLPITTDAAFDQQVDATIEQAARSRPLTSIRAMMPEDDASRSKLLIVEDNPDVVEYLITCFEEQYQLAFAYNGEAGIEKAFELSPDIIVTDVMMPKKDGFEVVEILKSDPRTSHIPIVVLTAKADLESRIIGLNKGADAYVGKPFYKPEMLTIVDNLIQLRKKLRDRYTDFSKSEDSNLTPDEVLQAEPTVLDLAMEDEFILKLKHTILEHIDDSTFGIAQLCRAMKMSRSHLHNKIKALTGFSTSIYWRSIRLEKAKSMLASLDQNVSETAYAVGFEDPKYFSRLFIDHFGVAPSEFMKKDRKNT